VIGQNDFFLVLFCFCLFHFVRLLSFVYWSVCLFPSVIFLFLVCYILFLLFIFLFIRVFQSLLIVLETAQREIARLTAQLSLTDRFICFVCVKFLLTRNHLRCCHVSAHDRALTEMVASSGKGRARSFAFELQVRSLLASGCSARAAREQLLQSATAFLRPESAEKYASLVPNLRWFQSQREGLGNEAWLYGMVELCRANECLQHGFDETSIDGTPTLNQWVLLEAGANVAPKIVTIQCAGLLVGSTAGEIASHIEQAWDVGQRAISLLRAELGDEADKLVPLTNGGVQLHKLRGTMHDTCATANLAASMIGELREISGQLQFGYDDWANKAQSDKPWFDFLCANHVRNLPPR
jgi:hypothetical protein